MYSFLLSGSAAVVKIPFNCTITFLFKSQNRSARVTESSFSCLPSLSFCLKKKREGTEACSNCFNNLAANCQKVFQGSHAIEPGERNLLPYSSPQPSLIKLLEVEFFSERLIAQVSQQTGASLRESALMLLAGKGTSRAEGGRSGPGIRSLRFPLPASVQKSPVMIGLQLMTI